MRKMIAVCSASTCYHRFAAKKANAATPVASRHFVWPYNVATFFVLRKWKQKLVHIAEFNAER
jgi:hypothetical protein